jgi:hypothetical protein
MKIKLYITFLILIAAVIPSLAQTQARMEIDQARENLGYFDKEALIKSKEFIRKDSTYYVGYMYEGAYKYNRSSDALGYSSAIKPLQKAMDLLIKDYGRKLKVRSSDIMSFVDAYKYQYEYCIIAGLLEESYRNIEQPDKALKVLLDLRSRNLQKEYYGDAYTTIAWIYHRSRVHTNEKYSFLGHSIEENDRIAIAYCDSAVMKYKKNKWLNAQVFPTEYVVDDLYRVYHYKSLIHAYEMQIDSAEKYYELMRPTSIFPNNNYATWKLTLGDFGAAEEYYKKAQQREYTDKRIREANIMLSILDIYKGKQKEAIKNLQDMIKAQGSTPGFGWHNIALSRAYYYEGLNEESVTTANKASMFHELHIGTTWGQEQYNLALSLLNYMNTERKIGSLKFENKDWWWNVSDLSDLPGYYLKKYSSLLLLVNQFASNPERERVTYQLFSTESITTFDEIWHLLRGFSPDFFISKFEQAIKEDKRERVRKYFKYFIAKYMLDKGETQKATALFNEILQDKTLDKKTERLLIARIYEGLGLAAAAEEKDMTADAYTMKFYELYPQLVPYSDLKMRFNLIVKDANDETSKNVIEELKECNADWEGNKAWPTVTISFRTNEKKLREVQYDVISSYGRVLVPQQSFILTNAEESGKKLAYRLFNISKL